MTGRMYDPAIPAERIALVDLLDRVLGDGVVIAGDVTLSIADVDLVTSRSGRASAVTGRCGIACLAGFPGGGRWRCACRA